MAWYMFGAKLLHEPMMAQLRDEYSRHQASVICIYVW